ncbi:MAG: ferritin family protein [Candidatus Kapaibacterium sp.]
MRDIDLKDAIQIAIKAEDHGIKYYSELAQKFSKDQELKETFEKLAKDEVEHKSQFSDLMKSIDGKEFKMSAIDKEFIKGVNIEKFFEGMEVVDRHERAQAALTRAYAFEKESVLFYSGIRDIIGSSPELDKIIQYEKEHMTKLLKYIIVDDSKFRGIEDDWV